MTALRNILISGGSGLLGRKLYQLDPTIIAPPHSVFDITDLKQTEEMFKKYTPDLYIHCAAIVGTDECRAEPVKTIEVNVGGVINTLKTSMKCSCRYVYISTDYVFETNTTKNGHFTEDDPVGAEHLYARSKIAGEMVSAVSPNHLIIRTSFVGRNFIKYKGAFVDQYTSRDYVDILAPQIFNAAKSSLTGVIHIGTEKKSQYDLLKRAFPHIKPIRRADINPNLASDTSLNCDKWKRFQKHDS